MGMLEEPVLSGYQHCGVGYMYKTSQPQPSLSADVWDVWEIYYIWEKVLGLQIKKREKKILTKLIISNIHLVIN